MLEPRGHLDVDPNGETHRSRFRVIDPGFEVNLSVQSLGKSVLACSDGSQASDFELLASIGQPDGGEGGIRTHGQFNPSPVFKTGAINRSTTSP